MVDVRMRFGRPLHPEFERVAIVNRGEAAMRFINAVREFNQERGTRIRTIALYTDLIDVNPPLRHASCATTSRPVCAAGRCRLLRNRSMISPEV